MTRAQLAAFALLVVFGIGGLILWEANEQPAFPFEGRSQPFP